MVLVDPDPVFQAGLAAGLAPVAGIDWVQGLRTGAAALDWLAQASQADADAAPIAPDHTPVFLVAQSLDGRSPEDDAADGGRSRWGTREPAPCWLDLLSEKIVATYPQALILGLGAAGDRPLPPAVCGIYPKTLAIEAWVDVIRAAVTGDGRSLAGLAPIWRSPPSAVAPPPSDLPAALPPSASVGSAPPLVVRWLSVQGSLRRVDRDLDQLSHYLDHATLNAPQRWILAGRRREMRAARSLLQWLGGTPPASLRPDPIPPATPDSEFIPRTTPTPWGSKLSADLATDPAADLGPTGETNAGRANANSGLGGGLTNAGLANAGLTNAGLTTAGSNSEFPSKSNAAVPLGSDLGFDAAARSGANLGSNLGSNSGAGSGADRPSRRSPSPDPAPLVPAANRAANNAANSAVNRAANSAANNAANNAANSAANSAANNAANLALTPDPPSPQALIALRSLTMDRALDRLALSVRNLTGTALEIDILSPDRRRELIYVIAHRFDQVLDDLKQSQVTVPQLQRQREQWLRDLWAGAIADFFGRYRVMPLAEPTKLGQPAPVAIVPTLLDDWEIVAAGMLERAIAAPALVAHLILGDPLIIDGIACGPGTPAALQRAEWLLQNLLIGTANAIAQPLLNRFSDLEPVKQAFFDRRRLSTREVERFRNELSWQYRVERYFQDPKAIFESRHWLWIANGRGIIRVDIYAPRSNELRDLSGVRLGVTLALETRDAIAPRVRSTVSWVGRGALYLLQAVGRGLGLVGRGLLQGLGTSWQEARSQRSSSPPSDS